MFEIKQEFIGVAYGNEIDTTGLYWALYNTFYYLVEYYDITHLVPEMIKTFRDPEAYGHCFDVFKELLWELTQGKRIIYSGHY